MKLRHRAAGLVAKSGSMSSRSQSGSFRIPLLSTSDKEASSKSIQSEGSDGGGPNNLEGLKSIFIHPFSILLVCVPLGIVAKILDWGDGLLFFFNFAALVPLAKILGDATEELAAALNNDTISGLLNATFGNAVEMIVAIFSIKAGLIDIVKNSLLGSVLSNILLVLGSSVLLGGLSISDPANAKGAFYSIDPEAFQDTINSAAQGKEKWAVLEKEQKFPMKAAQTSMSLLFLACMTFALPTIFQAYPTNDEEKVLLVSRIGSLIIATTYIGFLVFMMYTHPRTLQKDEEGNDEDEEEAALSVSFSLGLMVAVTLVVSFTSDLLVDAIKGLVADGSVPAGFIGVILLPIAGNACEHAGAIRFCIQDRTGLAISIAVGSSTQVALLVVPFSVVIGWICDQPMDLDFGIMNLAVMLLSVMVVQSVLQDGRSNWLKGYMLVAAYVFIAVLYWFLPPSSAGMSVPRP